MGFPAPAATLLRVSQSVPDDLGRFLLAGPADPAESRWFRARYEVLWLVLLALAIRACAAWVNPSILNDSVTLLRSAERIRAEGLQAVLTMPDHPLVPWLVSLTSPAHLNSETAATALAVVAGAFAVWPLHVLTRRACGRHAATGACILYAALPRAVGVASVPLTSAVFLPLILAAVSLSDAACVPASRNRRIVRLVSAGAMAGLAYLCRPEGIVAALAAVVTVLLLFRQRRRILAAIIVAAAFLVVAAPYAIALSNQAGRFALSPKKDVARFAGVADLPPPVLQAARDAAPAAYESASALDGALTTPVIVLALVGAFGMSRWRHRRAARARLVLLGVAVVFGALVMRLQSGWGYGGARHILPGALFLLPFAGEGLLVLGGFIGRVVARRRLAVVMASFAAIPYAALALLRPVGDDLAPRRRLGEALAGASRAASPAPKLVVASFAEPLVAYYARESLRPEGDARDVPLWGAFGRLLVDRPDYEGQRAELVGVLRREGAKWLVLDLFRTQRKATGETVNPGRLLAQSLTEDGALGAPVVSPGERLVAFPVN